MYQSLVKFQTRKEALMSSLSTVLFQFVYTTVFGWLAMFLLIKKRSVIGCILVHAFCNWMGFPDVTELDWVWTLAGLSVFVFRVL
jgi:prenyl protein peptidase